MVLQGVAGCYRVLQGVAECNRVLLGVTGCYRVLQGVTGCYRVLQGDAGCSRVLQGVLEWIDRINRNQRFLDIFAGARFESRVTAILRFWVD